MKRNILAVVCCIFFILLLFGGFLVNQFTFIEHKNIPYLSNKEQFKGVFYSNINVFKDAADGIAVRGEQFNFQYNPNYGKEQMTAIFGDGTLSNSIWTLIKHCGITNIDCTNNSIRMYQYAPIAFNDICLGVNYDAESMRWTYYYQHNYDRCNHQWALLYRMYDMLFNGYEIFGATT